MGRRRDMLALAAKRQEQERQEGVKTSAGYFTTDAAELQITGARSLEATFRFTESTGTHQIPMMFYGYGLGFELTISTNTLLNFYCGRSYWSVAITPENTYHAVITYDETTAVCYLNGTLIKSFKPSEKMVLGAFSIGGDSYGASAWQGEVSSCRMFNYALSAAEVAALWNAGRPEEYVLQGFLKQVGMAADWPRGVYSASAWTFSPNSQQTNSFIFDLPQANGFSGNFMRFDALTDVHPRISIFFAWWNDSPASVKVIPYKIVVEYRCSSDLYGINGEKLFDANIGDPRIGIAYIGSNTGFILENNYNLTGPQWLELRVLSIEPVGCIAEYLPQNIATDPETGAVAAWLDSAHQLPANDEYLTPLLQSVGGYDMEVNGTPEIIQKTNLHQHWQMMEPMTLEGFYVAPGGIIEPQIVDGAIHIVKNEQVNSYGGSGYYQSVTDANIGDDVEYSFDGKAEGDPNAYIGMSDYGNLWHLQYFELTPEYKRYSVMLKNVANPCNSFCILKAYRDTLPGTIDVKNITIKVYRK